MVANQHHWPDLGQRGVYRELHRRP